MANSVIALLAVDEGKVAVAIAVHGTARAVVSAGEVAKLAGDMLGGSGGGKPDFAMAGGGKVEKTEETLAAIKKLVLG